MLGIRPENIAVEPGATAQGKVEVIEQMGAEVFLYATAGGSHVIARIPELSGVKVGDTVPLRFAMDRVRWFDAATSQAVG